MYNVYIDIKQVTHNAVAHCLPVPKQQLSSLPTPLSIIVFFHLTSYHMEYSFGQYRSAVLVLSPLSLLCPPLFAGQQKKLKNGNILGSMQHYSAATKTLVFYQHFFFLLNSKHSIIPDSVKKIISLTAETRTKYLYNFSRLPSNFTSDYIHTYLLPFSVSFQKKVEDHHEV